MNLNKENKMNKFVVSIAACLAVLGVVVAQVPGGVVDRERPAQGQRQGGGGGGLAVTCNDKFLFVVVNGTVVKYNADTMVKLSETKLPTVQRNKQD